MKLLAEPKATVSVSIKTSVDVLLCPDFNKAFLISFTPVINLSGIGLYILVLLCITPSP